MHGLTRAITSVSFPLLALFSHSSIASEALNAEQVTTLFSGKTVEYHHETLNFDFAVYYAPDGSLRGTREGQPMSKMHWSVNNKGELCIAYHQRNRCHPIMKQDGVYKKYKVRKDGETEILVTYRKFIQGNPNNF
jgi:hypothetical protein